MEFEEYLQGKDLSDRTVADYVQDLKTFTEWFHQRNNEDLSLAALTSIDIRDYRAWLLKCGRAPASINRQLAAIRAYGNWGVTSKTVEANPAAVVRGVRQQARAPKWLDKQQQSKLIREVEKDKSLARTDPARWAASRNLAIIMALLHTGLRVSELIDLTTDDIHLAPRSGSVKVTGKGTKVRQVPLNVHARNALVEWLEMAAYPLEFIAHPFLLSRQAVHKIVAEYGRRAEVPASPHILRHTFAKNLVDAGVPLDQVAMLLGHARLETTRIYTMPGELDLQRAVERLEM